MEAFIKWAPAISVLVVISGLIWNNFVQNKRETRKEIWDWVKSTTQRLETLKKNSFDYHTGLVSNNALATEIKSEIKKIAQDMKLLDSLKLSNVDERIKNIRKNITLRNFETSNFKTLSAKDPLLEKMLSECDALAIDIMHAFKSKYH